MSALNSCLRWFGRIAGFVSCGFVLLFFIGEGFFRSAMSRTDMPMLLFLFLYLASAAGYITSFFKERAGGLLLMAGGAAMAAYHLISGGLGDLDAALIYGLPFILCGIAFYAASRNPR